MIACKQYSKLSFEPPQIAVATVESAMIFLDINLHTNTHTYLAHLVQNRLSRFIENY